MFKGLPFTQFTLDFPQARGGGGIFNSTGSLLPTPFFCGGWVNATNTVADRPRFPLEGGQVSTTLYKSSGEASVFIFFGDAPSTSEEFNRTSVLLGGVRKFDSGGQWCFDTNVTEVGSGRTVKDGDLATIQVFVVAPQDPTREGSMRFTTIACADVVLSSMPQVPLTCEHTSVSVSAAGRKRRVGGLVGRVGVVGLVALVVLGL